MLSRHRDNKILLLLENSYHYNKYNNYIFLQLIVRGPNPVYA